MTKRNMKTWLIATVIVLFQITVALSLCRTLHLGFAYMRLCEWDSQWYGDIVERGYARYFPVPPPGHAKDNGGFFPGYPLSARFFGELFGLDSQLTLLAVAQGAAVVFWATFLFLLKRWHVGLPYRGLAVLAVLAHPCSFYLVAGYSESLFCAALVVFIYYSKGGSPLAPFVMTAAGFAVTATKMVGLPVVGLPALCWLFRNKPSLRTALLVGATSSLGMASFFLFSKLHFGDLWNYMNDQRDGWGVVPDYLAVIQARNYQWTDNLDRLSMILTPAALVLTAGAEFFVLLWRSCKPHRLWNSNLWRIRLPWYLLALAFWYVACSGVSAVSFRSLIRYSLPWSVLLIIAWTHLFAFSIRMPRVIKACAFAIGAVLLAMKFSGNTLELLNTYLHGGWVS